MRSRTAEDAPVTSEQEVFGGSSWPSMVEIAVRSSVLRCPDCNQRGHWIDTPSKRKEHLDRIPTRVGRRKKEKPVKGARDDDTMEVIQPAGTDNSTGMVVHPIVGQEWRCDGPRHHQTRQPRIGKVGSLKNCTMRGHGALVSDTNAVEDSLVAYCDSRRLSWPDDYRWVHPFPPKHPGVRKYGNTAAMGEPDEEYQ
jgi:hypothetical protein